MKLVNLTGHPLRIVVDGKTITLPPMGPPARVRTWQRQKGSVIIDGCEVPIVENEVVEVLNLPSVCENCRKPCKQRDGRMYCHMQEPKVMYVVSTFVARMLWKRKDLLAPDTGPKGAIRKGGKIVAVRRLQRWR